MSEHEQTRQAVAKAISEALPAYMLVRGVLDPTGKPPHWYPDGEGTLALADAALAAMHAAAPSPAPVTGETVSFPSLDIVLRKESPVTEADQDLVLTDDERKQLLDIAYQAFWERHPVCTSAGDRIMSEQHERAMRNDLYTLSPPTMEAMLEAVARRVWLAARTTARAPEPGTVTVGADDLQQLLDIAKASVYWGEAQGDYEAVDRCNDALDQAIAARNAGQGVSNG